MARNCGQYLQYYRFGRANRAAVGLRAPVTVGEGVTVQFQVFLDVHPTMLWLQLPEEQGRWYPAAVARRRIPMVHLMADVLITKEPGLDLGSLWLGQPATEYRWAMAHDQAEPFRPHPWPWPPLEQRSG